MRSFRLIPDQPRIPFVRYQYWAYAFSGLLVMLTLILLPIEGLNLGIDFRGGILIEVGVAGPGIELAAMRETLGGLGLGEVALQQFGQPSHVLIRIERQAGNQEAQRLGRSDWQSFYRLRRLADDHAPEAPTGTVGTMPSPEGARDD